MDKVRVRYAPSPTGFPHIGNIRTAVYDWLLVRRYGGSFILRIEDTDRNRLVEGSFEEILESLRWLGMQWDEGPEAGGDYGPYLQSERLEHYQKYAEELVHAGKAYRCFCTSERLAEMRAAQEARKEPTGYDRLCLSLAPDEVMERTERGEPSVIRFKVPGEGRTVCHDEIRGDITFENRLLDDFVILKSDGFPTYHLASIVDDHLMEITHVIRAEEWISSTPKHVLLYAALGWEPPKFVHPPLILGPDKSKLSKRHGPVRFLSYRDQGFLPEAIMNFITLLGWSSGDDQEIFTVEELISRFSIEGMVDHPVIFDISKLEWMNGVYIRECDPARLADLCLPYLKEGGLVTECSEYVTAVVALFRERLKTLNQIAESADFFFRDELVYEEKGVRKWLEKDYVPGLLRKLAERFEGLSEFTVESAEEAVRLAGEDLGISGGQVIHPVRMAVTGRTVGPGLFETIAILGRERVSARLNQTLEFIEKK